MDDENGRLGRWLGLHGRLFGGFCDNREGLRRLRQRPALPRFEERIEVDQIIPHRAVLA